MPSFVGDALELAHPFGHFVVDAVAFLEEHRNADQTRQRGRKAQHNGRRSKDVRRRHDGPELARS